MDPVPAKKRRGRPPNKLKTAQGSRCPSEDSSSVGGSLGAEDAEFSLHQAQALRLGLRQRPPPSTPDKKKKKPDVLCVSCLEKIVEGKGKHEHVWLYGYCCDKCYSSCIKRVSSWVQEKLQFGCEKCKVTGCDLGVFQARLLCKECAPPDCNADLRKITWKESVIGALMKTGPLLPLQSKRRLRVLSLFDGIGTGLYVLRNVLRLDIEAYFTSETDEDAVELVEHNFKGFAKNQGPVCNLTTTMLQSLAPIDLLIGGSPCNQFSRANHLRKGFDPKDSGILVFDFVKSLRYLQVDAQRNGRPLFYLFENVASMPAYCKEMISASFQCQPVMIDGVDFLPARRQRFFWGNIPGMHKYKPPARPRSHLSQILSPGRRAYIPVLPTITSTRHSQLKGVDQFLPVVDAKGNLCLLDIDERERLFGFPTDYTSGTDLSRQKRQTLLGKCWTVPVIEHILKPLKELYKSL